MIDVIAICGIIIGVILLIIGRKRPKLKSVKIYGAIIILISLAIAAPGFIKGFIEGWNRSF